MNLALAPVARPRACDAPVSDWCNEYIAGSEHRLFGALPQLGLVGKTFREAAIQAGAAGVCLIAMQYKGEVRGLMLFSLSV